MSPCHLVPVFVITRTPERPLAPLAGNGLTDCSKYCHKRVETSASKRLKVLCSNVADRLSWFVPLASEAGFRISGQVFSSGGGD